MADRGPEFDWESRGFRVNERPCVLRRDGKTFISCSASATDENYAMGLLWADVNADLLDRQRGQSRVNRCSVHATIMVFTVRPQQLYVC